MAEMKQVLVPDIGDYKGVSVIEVMFKVGDTINEDDTLLTLETDKAAMDIPSPYTGVVKEMHVEIGDKISRGSLILVLECAEQIPTPAPLLKGGSDTAPAAPVAAPAVAPPVTPPFEKGGLGGDFGTRESCDTPLCARVGRRYRPGQGQRRKGTRHQR